MSLFRILLFALVLPASLSAQSWEAIAGAPISWRFDDIYFLNPQKGWAINANYSFKTPPQTGRIFRTANGGNTWEKIFDSCEAYIRSIGFSDEQNGWFGSLVPVTADSITLYRTKDGGTSWTPVILPEPKPKGICGISVVTDSVIYGYGRFFGPPVIVKTTDKGATWTSQDLSSLATGLVDGYFFNKDTGFITGCYGTSSMALILSTTNGGKTWNVCYKSTRTKEVVWKIMFTSRLIGYASIDKISTNPPFNSYFLKTTDGGKTWKEKPFITSYIQEGLGFINDKVGWIGGDFFKPQTYKTEDGGDTWFVDSTFGVLTPPYNDGGHKINRFRKFGDSLMYASGNTIYRMKTPHLNSAVSEVPFNKTFVISPNPAVHELIVSGDHKSIRKVVLCTITGKEIPTSVEEAQDGLRILPATTEKLAGLYFLMISGDGNHKHFFYKVIYVN